MLGKPRAEEYPAVDMQNMNETGLDVQPACKGGRDRGLSFWSVSAAPFDSFSSIIDSCVVPVLGTSLFPSLYHALH